MLDPRMQKLFFRFLVLFCLKKKSWFSWFFNFFLIQTKLFTVYSMICGDFDFDNNFVFRNTLQCTLYNICI